MVWAEAPVSRINEASANEALLVVPVVLKSVPFLVASEAVRSVWPVMLKVPPSVVAPVPTVKVFEPVTEVAPFKLTAPVPVPKVPEPDCKKLPEAWA